MGFLKFDRKVVGSLSRIALVVLLHSCSGNGELEVGSPFSEAGSYELSIERKKNGSAQAGMGDLFTKTKVSLEVENSGDHLIEGKWNYGATALEGGDVQISAEEEAIINIYQGMVFDLVCDVELNKLTLNNYTEVRNQLEQLFFRVYGKDSITEGSEMYSRIKEMFNQRASNDHDLLENFFPEVPLFFGVIGKRFKHGELYSSDSIQSPYGPNFMTLVTSVEIEEEDLGPVIYKVDSLRSADIDQELRNYMNAMFGDRASEVPIDQFPRSRYQATTIIELDDDQNLRLLENE